MITGANTNMRHRGMLFHVQTEDSGRANPHIISHLYHQGTILASQKTEYADKVDAENLEALVRGLIESQHKSMLKRLKAGDFDGVIDERLGSAAGAATDGFGATPPPVAEPVVPPPAPPRGRPAPAPSSRSFGEGIVSQKPLDEVILEYLAEKARDRAAGRADKSAQKSRTSG